MDAIRETSFARRSDGSAVTQFDDERRLERRLAALFDDFAQEPLTASLQRLLIGIKRAPQR